MNNKQIKMPSCDDTKIITFGMSIIFVIFVLIGGWMAFAPLANSSVAMGKVSADTNKKTIQHLEGGIVDGIFVKDGDKVKKDQILLKIKDVQIKAQLDILLAQYQDSLALFNRLQSHRNNLEFITFSKELTDENIIKTQMSIFETIIKTQKDEKDITKNRIVQLNKQIDGLNSLINSKENRLASLSTEVLEWEKLFQEQLVDKMRIRELKREKNMVEGDLANTISEIAKIKEQISEVKTQQLLREKEFEKDNLLRLVETKSKLADIKSRIIATEDTLKRTTLVSPIDGTIVGLDLHTVGGIVTPGKPLLEIVPNNSKLIVIAQVQTMDIDKVRVGLVADIMFSAFNLKQVNIIQGNVILVSADSYIDEVTGMPYYEAKIEVTSEGIETLKENNFVLVSGMPAQVMINIGNRTALSYLVKPFTEMIGKGFNEE
ncbi:MAG: HlyD family type I secretion periplasmic adaptor subunit [Campylobacterota bacterium]|nr:HlyD family type I secretion periplasmic adaptor subunit [Campylobacterota bacterium]